MDHSIDPSNIHNLELVLSRLSGVKAAGAGWKCLCPAHDDKNPSLSITVADSGKILLYCHAGCTTENVMQVIGLEMAILTASAHTSPRRQQPPSQRVGNRGWDTAEAAARFLAKKVGGSVETIHEYDDLDEVVRFKVVRIRTSDGKTFRPLHCQDGRWHVGDPDSKLPLYRLGQIRDADEVTLVEGEKCVGVAEKFGVPATTSAHGSASAKLTDWSMLSDKVVTIWRDNDAAGHRYADDVVAILRAINPEVQIKVVLPDGLPEGGDIADWVAARESEGLDQDDISEALAILMETAEPWPATANGSSTYSTYSTGPSVQSTSWAPPRPLSSHAKPMPFPLDSAFPEPCARLRDFVAAVATSYQVPVDVPAMMAIATLALPVARTVEVTPNPDWREVIAIYALLLLSSGERKSAVFSLMVSPVHSWQDAQASAMAPAIRQFENEQQVAKEKIRNQRRSAAKSNSDHEDSLEELVEGLARMEQEAPKPPSLVATEATTEAIADMLIQNHERGMLAAAEGDAFDVMLGRYGQGRPNFGLWLSGHAGDSMAIRRKGRETLKLRRPALCVAMCVQPSVALELLASPDAVGRGVVARFMFSVPESEVGYREIEPPAIPRELTDWYGAKVHQLLDRPVPATPELLRLDQQAGALLREFRAQVEADLRPGGDLADRMSWGSKLPGAILRIAGVLHVVGSGGHGNGYIDIETMTAALAWDQYLRHHERLATSLASQDPALPIAERIVDWLRRHELTEFSQNECFNGVRSAQVKKAKDIAPALDLLIDHGWIRAQPSPQRPPGRAGRTPSPRFSVNPDACSYEARQASHNTHNTQNPPDDDSAKEGGHRD